MENVSQSPWPLNGSSGLPSSSRVEGYTKVIVSTSLALIMCVGTMGNLLLLLVLIDSKRRRLGPINNLTNMFIINITVSDLFLLLYNIPVAFFKKVFEGWRWGAVVCVSHSALTTLTIFSSFYSMVAIAVLRFIAVVYPMHSLALTQKHGFVMILIWGAAFVISIPSWMCHKLVDRDGAETCVNTMEPRQWLLYLTLIGGICFFPPMLLMITLYTKIIYSLWHREAVTANVTLQMNRNATVMILTVLVVFVVMWIPCWVIVFCLAAQRLSHFESSFLINDLAVLLSYSNTCVNPIIFFSFSDQYKQALKRMVKRCRRNNAPPPQKFNCIATPERGALSKL
ncbi:galanin receptor 2b-like [Acipenser ruthenus]|uniref:galanin receptor 2b-like n=1 Tax=Acipenser ruthenus TaxID=7906 RepID=UPI0027408CEE|nr:galanin receptor 2b-like [Acipenser ruthenus]